MEEGIVLTPEQLDTMEQMWADGISASHIADALGVTAQQVYTTAMCNRDRFPYRKRPSSQELRDEWADRIVEGKATYKQAVEELGVGISTVRRWVMLSWRRR